MSAGSFPSSTRTSRELLPRPAARGVHRPAGFWVLRQTDDVRGAQTPDAQQPQQRVAADLEDAAEKHEARARHWTMWARVTHAAQTGNQVHDLALAAEHAATARALRNTAAALCRPSTRGRNETATEPAAEPAVERRTRPERAKSPDSPKVPRTLDEAIKAILVPEEPPAARRQRGGWTRRPAASRARQSSFSGEQIPTSSSTPRTGSPRRAG